MGQTLLKLHREKHAEIHSFNDVTVPDGYSMIKLATYNINLKNSINLKYKVNKIIEYINSSYKDKKIDIICLQGIHDYMTLEALIKTIKRKFWAKEMYTAPTYDDIIGSIDPINSNNFTISRILMGSLKSAGSSKNNTNKKIEIQNLIISRFPIVSSIYNNMDVVGKMDDTIGIKAVIGANVSIGNTIVSIYSTQLSNDIQIADICNMGLRKKEGDILLSTIMENEQNNKNNNLTKNPHIICGTFNINYYDGKDISKEFTEFVTTCNYVDTYKYINPEKKGFTNTNKERKDYIFVKLTNDIFSDKKWKKEFKKIKNDKDLFNIIFKRYNIYFIDCYVRNDINSTNSASIFPVESVFIVN